MIGNRIPKIKGTKKFIGKNQTVISLGLPSLDSILGGGLPIGGCILLEEDEFGTYASLILKHFLAEGVVNDHEIFLASEDIDTRKLITELPSPLLGDSNQESQNKNISDELRIAWRYQNVSSDQASTNSPVFGNTFHLGVPMSKLILNSVCIDHWNPCRGEHSYNELLSSIHKKLKNLKYDLSVPSVNRTILRIALYCLGSGAWQGDIVAFLINLRLLMRNACVTCMITVPSSLFQEYVLHRCEHICDAAIELKSLLNEGNAAYSDYEGLLILKKLPAVNTWCPTIPDSIDWAFKVKKKRFIIEKLHISPDLNERTHREEQDVSKEYETQRIVSNVAKEF